MVVVVDEVAVVMAAVGGWTWPDRMESLRCSNSCCCCWDGVLWEKGMVLIRVKLLLSLLVLLLLLLDTDRVEGGQRSMGGSTQQQLMKGVI